MGDFKSKLPDFKELTSMASKLFNGIKKSVDEIVDDYKKKRTEDTEKEKNESVKAPTKPAKETNSEKKETQTPKRDESTKTSDKTED